jgi:hypothetical protein
MPHPPQFSASLDKSTHISPQARSSSGQLTMGWVDASTPSTADPLELPESSESLSSESLSSESPSLASVGKRPPSLLVSLPASSSAPDSAATGFRPPSKGLPVAQDPAQRSTSLRPHPTSASTTSMTRTTPTLPNNLVTFDTTPSISETGSGVNCFASDRATVSDQLFVIPKQSRGNGGADEFCSLWPAAQMGSGPLD